MEKPSRRKDNFVRSWERSGLSLAIDGSEDERLMKFQAIKKPGIPPRMKIKNQKILDEVGNFLEESSDEDTSSNDEEDVVG